MARFGPWQIPKCLEKGPVQDQKLIENGSKTRFSKSDTGPFGMLKQVFLAQFEPVVTRFGPWKVPKCLENGPFWDQKRVKNGSKTRFSKISPEPFGMLQQVFLAQFEPIRTGFGPWKLDHWGCTNNRSELILSLFFDPPFICVSIVKITPCPPQEPTPLRFAVRLRIPKPMLPSPLLG